MAPHPRDPKRTYLSQDKAEARKASLFSTVQLTAPDGVSVMSQTLWPRHCVANTWGSECPPELRSGPTDIIVYKGTHPGVDSYSAFYDNAKFNQTTMLKELRMRGVTHVFLTGVALDVCVAFSALHAAEEGFVTAVVEDACRGVSVEGIAEKKNLMLEAGVQVLDAADVPAVVSSSEGWRGDVLAAARSARKSKLISDYTGAEQTGHMGKGSIASRVAPFWQTGVAATAMAGRAAVVASSTATASVAMVNQVANRTGTFARAASGLGSHAFRPSPGRLSSETGSNSSRRCSFFKRGSSDEEPFRSSSRRGPSSVGPP